MFKVFSDIISNITKMSRPFKQLCLIHATSWLGMFILWLYFSTFIAQKFYNVPFTPGNDPSVYANAFAKASLDTSFYFSIYQYVSVIFALGLFFIPKTVNIKLIHIVSLVIGGISIVAFNFEHSSYGICVSAIGIGMMWGSLITVPYVIAMRLLPKGKVGIYLGVFNICITLPQLLCGLLLPFFYSIIFQKHASYLMVLSGLLVLLSAYLWLRNTYSLSIFSNYLKEKFA